MALGPIIAASLNVGLPTRPRSLWVAGVDVLYQPGGTSGLKYGVSPESITVTEAAYGGVSSMSFVLEDPASTITISVGMMVNFWDHLRDMPVFAGWVQRLAYVRDGLNRQIEVTCIGAEAILDWMFVPSLTFAANGPSWETMVQSAYAQALGIGVSLNTGSVGNSTQAAPVELTGGIASAYVVTMTNVTLREAIRQINESAISAMSALYTIAGFRLVTTVDFTWGLRNHMYWDSGGHSDNSLWGNTTISTAVSRPPVDTSYSLDAGELVHQVWVIGGNATGTGLVTDGTGLPGPIRTLSAPNVLTVTALQTAGLSFLLQNNVTVRGSFSTDQTLTMGSQASPVRVGSQVTLTDSHVGLTAYVTKIGQIDKRFLSNGLETWTITFGSGASAPSAVAAIRRLTRSTLS